MALFHRSMASIDRSSRSVAVVSMDRWRSASTHSFVRASSRARSAMATVTALADDGREGTGRVARASFDSVVDEDEDGSAASAASASASASEEEGDGFSSAPMGSRDDDAEERVDEETVGGGAQALGTLGRGRGAMRRRRGRGRGRGRRARARTRTGVLAERSAWCSTRRDGCVMRWDAMRMVSSIVSSRAGAVRWRTRGLTRISARAALFFAQDTDAAGRMSGRDCETTRTLRGKVSSEEDLSDVLGFNVKADLVGRADSAGLVSVADRERVVSRFVKVEERGGR